MQLLSNFMANWVGGKKKKDREKLWRAELPPSQPALLPVAPTPPALPSSTPLHPPCKGISGSLALPGPLQRFPPAPHPKDDVNPGNNPIPGQSPSQEPRGRAWTSRCFSYSLTAGASSPSPPVPHPPAAGLANAAANAASHRASSSCAGAGLEPPAARGPANSSQVSVGWVPTPGLPGRGAGQPAGRAAPATVIYLPVFLEPG